MVFWIRVVITEIEVSGFGVRFGGRSIYFVDLKVEGMRGIKNNDYIFDVFN